MMRRDKQWVKKCTKDIKTERPVLTLQHIIILAVSKLNMTVNNNCIITAILFLPPLITFYFYWYNDLFSFNCLEVGQ